MLVFSDLQHVYEVLFRLGLAALLGAAVGWERERRGHAAGIRTHMLIMVGCTLMTDISIQFAGPDPSRVAAQIVTGVGFLGAGSIIRRGGEVKGLTTAASIWTVAAIGMAVGLGGDFYAIAVAATVLAIVTLGVVDHLTGRAFGPQEDRDVEIRLSPGAPLAPVFAALAEVGVELTGFRREQAADGGLLLVASVVARQRSTLDEALSRVSALPDVTSARHEPT
jgi:putative Mg2+ transporter-C (MgtC) family protein